MFTIILWRLSLQFFLENQLKGLSEWSVFTQIRKMETFQGAKGAPFLVGQPDNQPSFWMLEEYSSIKYFNLQHHGTSSIYCSLMMIRVFQFFFKGTFLGIFQPSGPRGTYIGYILCSTEAGAPFEEGDADWRLDHHAPPFEKIGGKFLKILEDGKSSADFLQIFQGLPGGSWK